MAAIPFEALGPRSRSSRFVVTLPAALYSDSNCEVQAFSSRRVPHAPRLSANTRPSQARQAQGHCAQQPGLPGQVLNPSRCNSPAILFTWIRMMRMKALAGRVHYEIWKYYQSTGKVHAKVVEILKV